MHGYTDMKKHPKNKHNANLYRSGLEVKIAEELNDLGVVYEFEPKENKIAYTVPSSEHTYTPDFVITTKSGKQIIIETKGIWDYADRNKHLLIRQQHPHLDIRFIFTRSKSRIRKGSSTTYADICEGRGRGPFKGVTWKYHDKTIPIEWIEE
jgi:predicted nuclease of restriction endonuclease-like RecB superfamily